MATSTEQAITNAQKAVDNAQSLYDKAKSEYDNANSDYKSAYKDYQDAISVKSSLTSQWKQYVYAENDIKAEELKNEINKQEQTIADFKSIVDTKKAKLSEYSSALNTAKKNLSDANCELNKAKSAQTAEENAKPHTFTATIIVRSGRSTTYSLTNESGKIISKYTQCSGLDDAKNRIADYLTNNGYTNSTVSYNVTDNTSEYTVRVTGSSGDYTWSVIDSGAYFKQSGTEKTVDAAKNAGTSYVDSVCSSPKIEYDINVSDSNNATTSNESSSASNTLTKGEISINGVSFESFDSSQLSDLSDSDKLLNVNAYIQMINTVISEGNQILAKANSLSEDSTFMLAGKKLTKAQFIAAINKPLSVANNELAKAQSYKDSLSNSSSSSSVPQEAIDNTIEEANNKINSAKSGIEVNNQELEKLKAQQEESAIAVESTKKINEQAQAAAKQAQEEAEVAQQNYENAQSASVKASADLVTAQFNEQQAKDAYYAAVEKYGENSTQAKEASIAWGNAQFATEAAETASQQAQDELQQAAVNNQAAAENSKEASQAAANAQSDADIAEKEFDNIAEKEYQLGKQNDEYNKQISDAEKTKSNTKSKTGKDSDDANKAKTNEDGLTEEEEKDAEAAQQAAQQRLNKLSNSANEDAKNAEWANRDPIRTDKDNKEYYRTDSQGNYNPNAEDEHINNNGAKITSNKEHAEDSFTTDSIANILQFEIPRWGIPDYINERNSWQKQLYSITGEQGYFYFKLFFKFNTNYGLFGGIMGETNSTVFGNSNTAARYLYLARKYYLYEKLRDRILALYKFTSMLSYISSESPWFFKSINNLNSAYGAYINDFTKEKYIEIGCTEDATDMRLQLLMDLYTFACYDNINCKEIIPENLRKFDMTIMLMNIPIRYYQTAIQTHDATTHFNYKSTTGDSSGTFDNALSFQLFTFSNCEFDVNSFGNYYNAINNEKAFTLGKHSLKIKFDRCYKHTFNEWNEIMFGSDGLYYNEKLPHTIIGNSDDAPFYTPNAIGTSRSHILRLKALSSSFETAAAIPRSNLRSKTTIANNIIEDFTERVISKGLESKTFADESDYIATAGNLYGNYGVYSQYYRNKLEQFKRGTIKGNIYDYQLGVIGKGHKQRNTDYLNAKIRGAKHISYRLGVYDPLSIDALGKQIMNIANYDPQTGEYFGPTSY